MMDNLDRILFIRRDNIGDLICTTPAIRAVREKFPKARTGILVNTYNADAISNNPDIDEVYVYQKAKHVPDRSKLSVGLHNMRVLWKIRRERYDVAVGFGSFSPTLVRYASMTGAKATLGYLKRDMDGRKKFYTIQMQDPSGPLHEVERAFKLLSPLGISGVPSATRVFPEGREVDKARRFLNAGGADKNAPLVAFHISSRRTENRWPVDKFVELGRLVNERFGANILLLWSPGSEKNVLHPGDDEKAAYILDAMDPRPLAYRTESLRELIAALSESALVVCGDGGAMHIAAALRKPVVTIWGSTDPNRWRPWGTEHVLLQDGSRKTENVSVEEVFYAVAKLLS